MLAVLSQFGANAASIWAFALAVIIVGFVAAIILAGVSLIRRLLNSV